MVRWCVIVVATALHSTAQRKPQVVSISCGHGALCRRWSGAWVSWRLRYTQGRHDWKYSGPRGIRRLAVRSRLCCSAIRVGARMEDGLQRCGCAGFARRPTSRMSTIFHRGCIVGADTNRGQGRALRLRAWPTTRAAIRYHTNSLSARMVAEADTLETITTSIDVRSCKTWTKMGCNEYTRRAWHKRNE